jgi:hypothetical protein
VDGTVVLRGSIGEAGWFRPHNRSLKRTEADLPIIRNCSLSFNCFRDRYTYCFQSMEKEAAKVAESRGHSLWERQFVASDF